MKNSSKKVIAMLLVLCMGVLFVGCSKAESDTNEELTKIEKIKKAGKIVVGTCADYPPYEFHKEIDGKDMIVGFDIEIAKVIAADLGVELEIKDMKFDGLLPALVSDKIDFIAAGMSVTEERLKSVDFSKTYYTEVQKIILKKELEDQVKTKEDLKGLKIGAQKASTQEKIAQRIDGVEVKGLGKITDLILNLTNDKVDGVVLVEPVAKAYAEQNPNLFVPDMTLDSTGEDGVAIAINKGNEELVEAINKTLDQLTKEGKIDQFITEAITLSEE